MPFTDHARKSAAVLHGLEAVGKIAKSLVPEGVQGRADQAVALLGLVASIFDSIKRGLTGDAHIGDVERELAVYLNTLASNDAERQAAADAKFPSPR